MNTGYITEMLNASMFIKYSLLLNFMYNLNTLFKAM